MTSPLGPTAPVQSPLDVSSVASDTSRLATRANLEKAGQRFESVFTQMMLKSMRATHLADDIFSSKAIDTFRDMQDQKVAETMAAHQPLGIGKAMIDFLSKSQPQLQEGAAGSPAPTDEGAA